MKKQKKVKGSHSYIRLFITSFLTALFLVSVTYVIIMLWDEDKTAPVINNDNNASLENENIVIENNVIDIAPEEPKELKTPDSDLADDADITGEIEKMLLENTHKITPVNESETVLVFAGDVLLDDSYAIMDGYRRRGAQIENSVDPKILEITRGADICVINNEFTYTLRGEPTPEKTYTFRANPKNVSILKDMGVDVVSLANNHSYDFGEISLIDTLDTLNGAGIKKIGAGLNLDEASDIMYFINDDFKIALVAATQIERLDNPDTKGATKDSPGVFRCLKPDLLLERLEEASKNSDFVILFVHWGTENTAEPDWLQTSHAPKYVGAGADLIIGAHPHCLQGVAYVDKVPVVYSLGNFWFSSKTADTALLQIGLSLNDGEIKSKIRIIPARQENSGVRLLDEAEGEGVLQYLRGISPGVRIDGDGVIG